MKRNHAKQMIRAILFFWGCVFCFAFLDKSLALAEETTVTASGNDVKVIPDLYNTGAVEPEGGFSTMADSKIPCTIDGEQKSLTGAVAGNVFRINLKYANKDLNGNIVIENVDLSGYSFAVYGTAGLKEAGRNISFVFNNCKLKGFSG